ncbi:MAG: RNA polymerase sigma factor [Pyrinomonadaceae bacterium]
MAIERRIILDINSEDFVKRLKAGDPLAFDQLVDGVLPKLAGFLSSQFYEVDPLDLEEIASDVLLKVHKSVIKFDPKGKAKLTTWIFRIGLNATIDHVRRLAAQAKKAEFVRPQFLKDGDPDKQIDAFDEFAKNQWKEKERQAAADDDGFVSVDVEIDAVERALESLSLEDQTILRLRLIDMDYDQIAEIEGEKPATLRVRHKRALEKLDAAYSKELTNDQRKDGRAVEADSALEI